jgi:hypothetical protein
MWFYMYLISHNTKWALIIKSKYCQAPVAHICNPNTQEAEIRRITVWSQPGQTVCRTVSWKNPSQKRAGGVAQGAEPELTPSTTKTKHNKTKKSPQKQVLCSTTYIHFICLSIKQSDCKICHCWLEILILLSIAYVFN